MSTSLAARITRATYGYQLTRKHPTYTGRRLQRITPIRQPRLIVAN